MSLLLKSDVEEEPNNIDEDTRNIKIPKYFRGFNDLLIKKVVSKNY